MKNLYKTILIVLMSAACGIIITSVSCTRTETGYVRHNINIARDDSKYQGIDVSSHQQYIQWDKIKKDKNIHFAYIKATEGAHYTSPHYAYNVKMAHSNGMLIGSYHYFSSYSSVQEQYANFTRTVMANEQDIIPMVDVEKLGQWTRQELIDSLSLFMDLLTEHYGIQPMIYSQMSFYNDNLSPYFNKYPLYIARYSFRQPKIKWNGHYVLWQYTEKGVVPGVSSHVDLCRFSSDKWFDDIEMPSSSSQKSS